VLQYHPPKDPSIYIHRAGRTGRAGAKGASVLFYDHSEWKLVQHVRRMTRQKFQTIETPDPNDMHHAAVTRLLEQLLMVEPKDFELMLPPAERLLKEQGPRVLATAMAVLDGRHADLEKVTRDKPSLLTGRRGFTCLLAYDPQHEVADSEADARRIVCELLPKHAGETSVGRCERTVEGWAVDVANRWAFPVVQDIRFCRITAPFQVTMARQLPQLRRPKIARRRRLPWLGLQKHARRPRRSRRGVPRPA